MSAVGIDFGTTNSVVASWGANGAEALDIDEATGEWAVLGFDRLMPSVLATSADQQVSFGWAAKNSPPPRFDAVKRLFATQQEMTSDDAGGVLRVEEAATMIFAELKRSATAQGVDASRAVITVPANSRGLARHRTKICAGMAGWEVLALINEPTAAAMSYAMRNPGDQQLLVFDWGGGTLDVTILRSTGGIFMEQASKGLPTRGGIDFDSRLRRLIVDTVPDVNEWTVEQRHQFALDVELAKIKLSSQPFTVIQLPNGDSRRITQPMFEEAARGLIDEAQGPIRRCLDDIGAGAGSMDALVMVGGTSNIPSVRRFVADIVGLEPVVDIDPMTAVGEGAAVAAAILTGELETSDFFVSTEHAMGTVTLDPVRREPSFSVLIPRNHKLPAKKTDTYVPVFDEQESVDLQVIEGDPELPVYHPDNVIIHAWSIPLPGTPGDPGRAFDVTYEYDTDGILHVLVADALTGALMDTKEISYGITEDKRRLVEVSKRVRQTVEDRNLRSGDGAPPQDPEAAQLLQRAHVKVIPFLDDDEVASVRAAAEKLEQADANTLDEAKTGLRDALAPYSYLF